MVNNSTIARTRSALSLYFGARDLDPNNFDIDDDLFELGLDSIGVVSILLAIEDVFNIDTYDLKYQMEDFRSIRAIAALLERESLGAS